MAMADVRIKPGCLYIVATPIGNLGDITYRAVETLSMVDLIVCEDTRVSRKLLSHYQIHKPLMALHDHNETTASTVIIEKIQAGQQVALISDAGTPLISDPGYVLVAAAIKSEIVISPIPGVNAAISALSVAGLPCRFSFEGFFPKVQKKRIELLTSLMNESRTMIFYESCHRIIDTLNDIKMVMGLDRPVTLAKELTKLHEKFYRAPVAQIIPVLEQDAYAGKGEYVLLIAGVETLEKDDAEQFQPILAILLDELPLKQAVKITANLTKIKKNKIYQAALLMLDNQSGKLE